MPANGIGDPSRLTKSSPGSGPSSQNRHHLADEPAGGCLPPEPHAQSHHDRKKQRKLDAGVEARLQACSRGRRAENVYRDLEVTDRRQAIAGAKVRDGQHPVQRCVSWLPSHLAGESGDGVGGPCRPRRGGDHPDGAGKKPGVLAWGNDRTDRHRRSARPGGAVIEAHHCNSQASTRGAPVGAAPGMAPRHSRPRWPQKMHSMVLPSSIKLVRCHICPQRPHVMTRTIVLATRVLSSPDTRSSP